MVEQNFKMTEVGLIPEDWEVKNLSDLVKLDGLTRGPFGGALKKEIFVKSGYKVYEQRNAIYSSVEIGRYYITKSKYIELSRFAICPHDFILSCSGTIGRIFMIPHKFPQGVINQALLIIRTNDDVVSKPFFYHSFISEKIQKKIIDDTQGGAMKNLVGMSEFRKIKFTIPPLPEQRAIATALSDADSWIESLEKLLAKKRLIKQAAMQRLLTPGEDWEVRKLGEILFLQVGYPFNSIHFNQDGRGVRLIKNRDLKNDDGIHFYDGEYPRAFLVNEDDILIGMDGDFIPCRWRKGKALLNQRVGRLVKREACDLLFFYYYVGKPLKDIEERTASTTVKHLSHGDIEKIEIALPKGDEQTRIATILSNMDAEIESLEKKLQKAKQIKQGMMQLLLTGKVRLVGKDEMAAERV